MLKNLSKSIKENNPFLTNKERKRIISGVINKNISNKLYFLLGKEDVLKNKILKRASLEEITLISNYLKSIYFYLERIFDEFPWKINNYPQLVGKIWSIIYLYKFDRKKLDLLNDLLWIVYSKRVFKKPYNRKEYFEILIDNIEIYLDLLDNKDKLNISNIAEFIISNLKHKFNSLSK
jgi:hypothetical protein